MSAETVFRLQIYAEDGVFYEGDCVELILPCVDGEKAFLAHHEDAVYAVYNGIMRFLIPAEEASAWRAKRGTEREALSGERRMPEGTADGAGAERRDGKPLWQDAVVGKGVAHFADNACVVLAETAERPEDIDENRARAALERAQEKMQKELSMREYRISQMAMARAMARIRATTKKELG